MFSIQFEIGLLVLLRREVDVCRCVGLTARDGLVGQRLNLDEPLRRKPRLDDRLAAVAVAHVVGVVLDAGQQALLFQVGDDLLARKIAVESRISAAFGIDVRLRVHHVDRGQMMALAQGKVIGVVRRRHLHRAGAEVAADPLVENDGNLAVHQRQAQFLAVQMQIALVFGMNGNGYVAEHGLGARRRHRQKLAGILAIRVDNRIPNLPQVALLFLVDHFQVADGRLAARAPVHDVCAAIDQSLLVQADEGLAHRDREPLVHGEVFALPVNRRAQPLHLVENGAAVVPPPLPHALDECLAAQLLAALAFARSSCRSTIICVAMPAWSVPGSHSARPPLMRRQRVRMSISVWLSMCPMCRRPVTLGGGSRIVKDWPSSLGRLRRCGSCGRRLGEEVLAHPVFGPVIFNGGGVVGFGQVVRHERLVRSPRGLPQTPFTRGFERGDHPQL